MFFREKQFLEAYNIYTLKLRFSHCQMLRSLMNSRFILAPSVIVKLGDTAR